jgi:alginate O-acetyltransferase complex protein AlgI
MMIYMAAPGKIKNTVLVLASLFFYAWGEPVYVILMLAAILIGYIFGILIEKFKTHRVKCCFEALAVVISLGVLGYFKYADFFIANFNKATGLNVPFLNVALPIGISFYTFQLLSYIIDVSRKNTAAQKNIIKLAAYISMFPQLIAGPIVRYSDIEKQLDDRKINAEKMSNGIRRFAIGLGKKVILANSLGELVELYSSSDEKSILFAWIYAFSITLQIYFDFSGYSDMAIGLGSMLGFDFPENFRYPLISQSVAEFWRRWHITLGSWFRDYLYIPLGGNRVSFARWILNILIVWAATGLWHGASWNFVIWGLYFAFFLVIEKKWLKKYLEKAKVLNHIYLVLVIVISFVIFDNDLSAALENIKIMFAGGDVKLYTPENIFAIRDYLGVIIFGVIGATNLPVMLVKKISRNLKGHLVLNVLEPVFVAALLVISVSFLINGSFNPFMYFRF